MACAGLASAGAVAAWTLVGDPVAGEATAADRRADSVAPIDRPADDLAAAVEAAPTARVSSIAADAAPCLELGHTSITGRVVDDEGRPSSTARVAILAAPHVHDGLAVRGVARADEHGHFDVRTPQPGDVWLVAYARDRRPTLRRFAVEEGFVELREPLVLERGVTIDGRLLAGGEPLERVEMEAVLPHVARRVAIEDDVLALCDGTLEWFAPRSLTDETGAWSFHGLGPGRRVVRPHAWRCPTAVFSRGSLAPETLEAPSRDVVLTIPSARVDHVVEADGAPVPWAEIEVEVEGSRASRRADAHGRLTLDVPPRAALVLVVRAAGRVPTRTVVTAPERGARRQHVLAAGVVSPPVPGVIFRASR